MAGLKTCTRLRAIMDRRKRRISSSLFPENIGPQITSIHPTFPVTISIGSVFACFREDQDMLPGQGFQALFEVKSLRFDLRFDLRDTHLMLGTDGDLRVLLAILEQHQASIGLERLPDLPQHL